MSSYKPSNLFDLTGRIAVVTGGGTGIGLMIAQGLAAAGAKVYITSRRLNVLEKVANEWNEGQKVAGEIVPLQVDVTDKESIQAARDYIKGKEGKLHILFNNAGHDGPGSTFFNKLDSPEHSSAETLGNALLASETFDQWSALYKINVSSIYFVTNAFLGLLNKGSEDDKNWWSVVVNITSISGIMSQAQDHFCYNSSKAAAGHLTKMFATEFALKGLNIRANAIAPGVYESEMTKATLSPEEIDLVGKGLQPVPAKRAGTGEEMAGTALYLASKAGAYTNGQEIAIDGGFLATNP